MQLLFCRLLQCSEQIKDREVDALNTDNTVKHQDEIEDIRCSSSVAGSLPVGQVRKKRRNKCSCEESHGAKITHQVEDIKMFDDI